MYSSTAHSDRDGAGVECIQTGYRVRVTAEEIYVADKNSDKTAEHDIIRIDPDSSKILFSAEDARPLGKILEIYLLEERDARSEFSVADVGVLLVPAEGAPVAIISNGVFLSVELLNEAECRSRGYRLVPIKERI